MRVFCSYSIPLDFLLGDRPVSCLDIQPEFDETTLAPVFYQGDDDYPSSVQVCRVLDSRTKMDAILAYEVAEKYWAGEDIMQKPLFYNETVQYYDVDSDKEILVDRSCCISYDEDINSGYDDRKEEYPYLFLPYAIQDAVSGRQPRKPTEPYPPKKPEGRPIKDSLLSLLLWVPLVLVSTILIVFSIAIRFYGGIFWAILIGVVLGFVIREKVVSKHNLVASSEMDQEDRKYKIALEAYEEKLKEYQEELKVYENLSFHYKEYSHSEYVSYLLGSCLDEYSPPAIEPNLTAVKQGPAERFFLSYLKERMSDDFDVLSNKQTKHYFRNGGGAYYYPDIALRNKPTGLMIDIEIDEPYIAKTGAPIHCYKDDDDRNHALVDDNWIVLRFTEEQIIRFPDICMAYIRTVCSSILTHKGCDIPMTWEFSQNHWSSYEARQMADSNYRLKYLPKDAHRSVYVPKKSIPANQNTDIVDLSF